MVLLGSLACSPFAIANPLPIPGPEAEPAARSFGGAGFPATALVGGLPLQLNGAGIRYKAMFQVYAAGLYLEQLHKTAEGAMQAPGRKRIAATMLRRINASELGNLFTKGILDNNSSQATTQLLPSVARMSTVFSRFKVLEPGEQFMADRLPGKGMVLTVKGEPQHEPFEEAFFDALLNIWLGPKPADRALKQAMLGTDPYTRQAAATGS